MKTCLKLITHSFFLIVFIFILASRANAAYCDPPLTGNWTISAPCVLYEDVNGPAAGDITLQAGTSLTIHNNKTLVWYPGHKITIPDGATIIVNNTGQIKQAYICTEESGIASGYAKINTSTDISGNTLYLGLKQVVSSASTDTTTDPVAWWRFDDAGRVTSAGSFTFPVGTTTLGAATSYENYDLTIQSGATVYIWGTHRFASVTVQSGGILDVGQYGESSDTTRGRLTITANTINVTGTGKINAYGRGYGGGGGGGGGRYGDSFFCPDPGVGGAGGVSGSSDSNGIVGESNAGGFPNGCRSAGGAGGGYLATAGQTGPVGQPGGNGGAGAGTYGGAGGTGTAVIGNPPAKGGSGTKGGYLGAATNGDATTTPYIVLGSGGGGGGASSSNNGNCGGGGAGGDGGVAGGASPQGCYGGAGAGGGGTGGGAVSLTAYTTINISGQIIADGAGNATLNAGYGAGGGVFINAPTVNLTGATIRSLGGNQASSGSTTNGGTVKVFVNNYTGNTLNTTNFPSGRVYTTTSNASYTASDSSGNGITASLVNTPTWVTGRLGYAVSLTAASLQYATATNTILDNITGSFTLSAWVYRTGVGNTYVIGKIGAVGTGGFGLLIGNLGEVYCRTDNGSTYQDSYTITGKVPASTWTHIAAVRGLNNASPQAACSTCCRVYINGVDSTNTPASHTLSGNTNAVNIGARSGTPESYFPGRIDDVRIYNRALSASEISTMYSGNCGAGYKRREDFLSKDYVDMGTTGTTGALATIYKNLLNLGMSIYENLSPYNLVTAKPTGTGYPVAILGNDLQVCSGAACSLTPPVCDGTNCGNLIVENSLGIGIAGGTVRRLSIKATGAGSVPFYIQDNDSTGYLAAIDQEVTLGARLDLYNNSGTQVVSLNGGSSYINGTTPRLGIGTATPSQPLDVNGYAIMGSSTHTSIQLRDDESTTGPKYIHANSNVVGFLNGAANWISYWDNAGNQVNTGTITAPTFSGALSGNATTATNLVSGASPTIGTLSFYGVGGDSGQGADIYGTYQASGAWANPFPDLNIRNHTGIQMEAYYGYGGIRMYDGQSLDILAFAVGNGDQTVKSYQTFYAAGANIGTTTTAGDQALNVFGNAHFYTSGGGGTGYVYSDGSPSFGLLNNQGNWGLWIPPNTVNANTSGGWGSYGASGVAAYNSADTNSDVNLNYSATSVPRIRVGGTGAGSQGPFAIRGTGEVPWFSVENTGNIVIPGATSYGVFTQYGTAVDGWFRIVRNNARTTYHDLAVGPFFSDGNPDLNFDLAEVTPVDPDEELTLGQIVAVDDGDKLQVTKSGGRYDDKIVGIVSHVRTASMTIGGDTGPEKISTTKDRKPIALVGRVVTMVNLESGAIKSGDPITSSSTPGIGMKATEAGTIIGRAMENFDGSSVNSKEVIKMVEELRKMLTKEDPKTAMYAEIQDAINQLTKSLPKGTGRVISFVTVAEENTDQLKDKLNGLQKELNDLINKQAAR